MAIKKSELYATILANCYALYGGMDACQYKDYVFVLLKYMSDKTINNPYAHIEILAGASFNDLRKIKSTKNIGVDSTINQIATKSLKSFEISFPPLEEQNQIATILSDMDAEINALETKLAKYQQVKQGMMQNLLTGKIRLV